MPLSVSRSKIDNQVKAFVHNMASCIRDELPSTIYITLISGDVFNITHKQCPQLELGVIFNRCMDINNIFLNVNPNTCIHWTWTPKFTTTDEYAIDWFTSRWGHALYSERTYLQFSFHLRYYIMCRVMQKPHGNQETL